MRTGVRQSQSGRRKGVAFRVDSCDFVDRVPILTEGTIHEITRNDTNAVLFSDQAPTAFSFKESRVGIRFGPVDVVRLLYI